MKRYTLGTLGALVGGFLFAIPWVLIYVYGNFIFSILAALIAMGAILGYKLLKGPLNKKTSIIITIVSLVVVVTTTMVIIPLFLLAKEGYDPSFALLEQLYADEAFLNALLQDLLVSVLFTFLGISGVVRQLKQEIDPEGEGAKYQQQAESLANIKQAFEKLGALDKQHAVSKEQVLEAMGDANKEQLFRQLRLQQIIKKSHGMYYFSEKAEKSAIYRFGTLYLKVLVVMIVLLFIIFLFI